MCVLALLATYSQEILLDIFPSFLPFLCVEIEESPRPDCSGTALPWSSHYLQVHYLCCSFISLLGEMSGEMLPCSPKGVELGWLFRYCPGYWWCTLGCLPCIHFSPELVTPVFESWGWRLVWIIHSFLLGEQEKTLSWTLLSLDINEVVCVQMFEQLRLALLAPPPPLQSPPTTPICLRKLGDSPLSLFAKADFWGCDF